MKLTIEVEEAAVEKLVKERVAELFSTDSRYRETGAREMVRRIVDAAAVSAVEQARSSIESKLPAMAAEAVDRAVRNDIDAAAKRGISALKKMFVGFDPAKLMPDQRAWLETQIAKSAATKTA